MVQALRQAQDLKIGVRRRADNHLGALAGRDKGGGMPVNRQLLFILADPVPDPGHRPQDGVLALVGGKLCKTAFAGHFDINAHPVAEHAELLHQLRRAARNGLGVDIAVEAVLPAQQLEHPAHLFHRVIRVLAHAGAQEQPLDIIPAVKLNGQRGKLFRRRAGPRHVV